MSITPYLDVAGAQEYFDDRLNTEAWDEATDENRLKALKMATRLINNLNFVGIKFDPTQINEFPRYGQVSVPNDIMEATCELALQILDEPIDINLEIENLSASSRTFAMTKTDYVRDFVLPHLRAGIISAEAWMKLLPYLRDPLNVKVVKL